MCLVILIILIEDPDATEHVRYNVVNRIRGKTQLLRYRKIKNYGYSLR